MADTPERRGIPAPQLQPAEQPLKFSFKYLDRDNPKFRIDDCPLDFFVKLLERVQVYSTWTVERFCDMHNNEHRHVIDFPTTTEPEGFKNVPNIDEDQLGVHESWQFEVCPKTNWRVHGILIDDTFFVVWLDSQHALFTTREKTRWISKFFRGSRRK